MIPLPASHAFQPKDAAMTRIDYSDISSRCFRTDHNIGRMINNGREKAHAKHGENSIESKSPTDVVFWLSCLMEEVGEVAECFTYDKPTGEIANELLDVLCVAAAWLDALRVEANIVPDHGAWLA